MGTGPFFVPHFQKPHKGWEAMTKRRFLLIVDGVVLACALAPAFVDVAAKFSTNQKYVWSGELISYDQKGKTLTVKAPYREHISDSIRGSQDP